MEYGVPLEACRFCAFHYTVYFHDISAFRGRLNVDVWEEELEPDDVLGWEVDDIAFSIGLVGSLKGVGDI